MDTDAKEGWYCWAGRRKIVASTLIVFHHYQQVYVCKFEHWNFFDGRFGFSYIVELFFMISGFLALYTYRSEGHGTLSWYASRFFKKLVRFVPMVTLALFATIAIRLCLGTLTWEALFPRKFLINLFLLFAGYPPFAELGINNPTWYLCVLIQCYIAFYCLMYVTDKMRHNKRLVRVILSFAIIAVVCVAWESLDLQSCRGLGSYFIGVALCDILEFLDENGTFARKKTTVVIASTVLCFAIAGLMYAGTLPRQPLYTSSQRTLLLVAVFPCIVIASYLFSRHSKGHAMIREIASISFEVYIWHYPCLLLEVLALHACGLTIARSHTTMALFAAGIWVVALIIYRFLEMPLQSFITRWIKTMHKRKRSSMEVEK